MQCQHWEFVDGKGPYMCGVEAAQCLGGVPYCPQHFAQADLISGDTALKKLRAAIDELADWRRKEIIDFLDDQEEPEAAEIIRAAIALANKGTHHAS